MAGVKVSVPSTLSTTVPPVTAIAVPDETAAPLMSLTLTVVPAIRVSLDSTGMTTGVAAGAKNVSAAAVGGRGDTFNDSVAVPVSPAESLTVYVTVGTEPAYPVTGTNV